MIKHAATGICLVTLLLAAGGAMAKTVPVTDVTPTPPIPVPTGIWTPDQGDGTYINPVLNGDYSDPDVTRVGEDFYLTSSSFTNAPGLPMPPATILDMKKTLKFPSYLLFFLRDRFPHQDRRPRPSSAKLHPQFQAPSARAIPCR